MVRLVTVTSLPRIHREAEERGQGAALSCDCDEIPSSSFSAPDRDEQEDESRTIVLSARGAVPLVSPGLGCIFGAAFPRVLLLDRLFRVVCTFRGLHDRRCTPPSQGTTVVVFPRDEESYYQPFASARSFVARPLPPTTTTFPSCTDHRRRDDGGQHHQILLLPSPLVRHHPTSCKQYLRS